MVSEIKDLVNQVAVSPYEMYIIGGLSAAGIYCLIKEGLPLIKELDS